MTRAELIDSLTSGLKKLLKGYTLPSRLQGTDGESSGIQNVMQEVKVFAQYLPQPEGITFDSREYPNIRKYDRLKNYDADDYESNFPCVIVKLGDMTDNEEQSRNHSSVKVSILAGVYDESPECQGYMDLLNLQEVIRKWLLEERVLSRKFLLRMPMVSKLDDSETWPVYFGTMELTYELGRPVRSSEYVYRYERPEIAYG